MHGGTPWGSRKTDTRGERVLEWMELRKLKLLNDGRIPTFVKGGMESFIDLTFCTPGLADKILQWRVMEEKECCSDHQPIILQMNLEKLSRPCSGPTRFRKLKEELREPLMEKNHREPRGRTNY